MNKKELDRQIELDKIIINECTREGFKACYFDGMGYGTFKGEVIDIKDNKYLFKRIHIEYMGDMGIHYVAKEDHVWITDKKEFAKKSIKIGDKVKFSGRIKVYQRSDGSHELGICEITDCSKIDDYELPTSEELEEQFLKQVRCETCMYKNQCYGTFCMMP